MDSYPSDWNARRKAVYERDDYTCQNCGRDVNTSGELHAHHIVPIKNGGSHSKSNLVAMCSDCHDAIHNNKQAPTAHGIPSTSSSLTNYEDIDKFNEYFQFLSDRVPIYTAANIRELGPNVIIQFHNKRGAEARNKTQTVKSQFAAFDPYDNVDSEYVEEEFKNIVDQYRNMVIEVCDQILVIDRLFSKYVEELTSVECGGCGIPQSEEDSFCGECGTEIPVLSKCPDCLSYREDISQEFCKSCGTGLNEYSEGRISQLDTTLNILQAEIEEMASLYSETVEFNNEVANPSFREQLN